MAVFVTAKRWFEDRAHDAHDHEHAHDGPKGAAALIAFALFENIAAVAAFFAWAVEGLFVDEAAEARQDFFWVESDETCVGSDETTNERFGRKVGEMIPFNGMKKSDADFGRRGDLFNGDAPTLAFLSEELSQAIRVVSHLWNVPEPIHGFVGHLTAWKGGTNAEINFSRFVKTMTAFESNTECEVCVGEASAKTLGRAFVLADRLVELTFAKVNVP